MEKSVGLNPIRYPSLRFYNAVPVPAQIGQGRTVEDLFPGRPEYKTIFGTMVDLLLGKLQTGLIFATQKENKAKDIRREGDTDRVIYLRSQRYCPARRLQGSIGKTAQTKHHSCVLGGD